MKTLTIHYCPKCRWLLRASWLAQELLTTFPDDGLGVLLQPARISGQFTVMLDAEVLWDRKEMGRFPEPKEIKQRVRDIIAPAKSLGHSDKR